MLCPYSRVISTRQRASTWTESNRTYDRVSRFLPCGKCPVCHENLVNSWIPRLLAECRTSQHTYFLTLTYDEEHLVISPEGIPTLVPRHPELYFKRIRKALGNNSFRYYCCGEYGGRGLRPHYHVLMFSSVDLAESGGHCVFAHHWDHGHVHCGSVTAASIRYVANFHVHKGTPVPGAELPFTRMSRRPGIGGLFFDEHIDNYSSSRLFLVHGGQPYSFGAYFKNRYTQSTGEVISRTYSHPVLTAQERFFVRYPDEVSLTAARSHVERRFRSLLKKHNKL